MLSAYDQLGIGYTQTRRPDRRIAEHIRRALGECASVVNVGAGAGSYEPHDCAVLAVEPSLTMIAQRPVGSAPVVRGVAEALPLGDDAVDAALAVLTLHHWNNAKRGLAEMRRVSRRRVVIFTWDPQWFGKFWLVDEYLPSIRAIDRVQGVKIATIAAALGDQTEVIAVPIAHDCVDGFLGAYWRRPEAFLDARVRAGVSVCAKLPRAESERGLQQLADDIESRRWHRRHRELLEREELDLGYRLIVHHMLG
jgi:SAM-dependent methyltransferase